MPDISDIKTAIDQLSQKKDLSDSQSEACLEAIFTGDIPTTDIVSLLSLLHQKGESVSELVGFAKCMKAHMKSVALSEEAIDICGTGGSGKDRFNISTAIAFILAANGIPVAKHGNRGSRKPNGSFDFLEALNIPFDIDETQIRSQFNRYKLAFFFARNHHPAMRHVVEARKQLSHRSIFNSLGPLCNPANVSYQIIGCIDETMAQKLAKATQALGTKKTLVIIGGGTIDEVSACLPSKVLEVRPDTISTFEIAPQKYFDSCPREDDVKGGSAKDNAETFISLLEKNDTTHPLFKMMQINIAAALYIFPGKENFDDAMKDAATFIENTEKTSNLIQALSQH